MYKVIIILNTREYAHVCVCYIYDFARSISFVLVPNVLLIWLLKWVYNFVVFEFAPTTTTAYWDCLLFL